MRASCHFSPRGGAPALGASFRYCCRQLHYCSGRGSLFSSQHSRNAAQLFVVKRTINRLFNLSLPIHPGDTPPPLHPLEVSDERGTPWHERPSKCHLRLPCVTINGRGVRSPQGPRFSCAGESDSLSLEVGPPLEGFSQRSAPQPALGWGQPRHQTRTL